MVIRKYPDGGFLATFRGFLGDISGVSWRQGHTQTVEAQGVTGGKILYILYIHYKVNNRGVIG